MRNQPKPLDDLDNRRQERALDRLSPLAGSDKVVSVQYVKRNGQASSSTGRVTYFNGRPGMDTGSVTIETEDKGPRTINLHRITNISD